VQLLKSVAKKAAEVEEDVDTPAPHEFKLTEGPEPGAFTFTRELNGEKITICGNAFDIEESANDEPEEEVAAEEEEEDQAEVGVPVTLEFVKGTKTLNISATAWGKSGWSLKQVGTSADSYQAEVAHFDEPLMNSFYDYLAERGVDDELAIFVAGTAYKSDHQLYRNWVQDMTNYFQAK
jgi:hypothetical protein